MLSIHNRLVNIFVISLIFAGICLADEPVAERPIYSMGDRWSYVDEQGKEWNVKFLREEDGKYIFEEDTEEAVRDFELSLVRKKKHQGHPGPIIKFPLKVGNKWDYEYRKKRATGNRIKDSRLVSYKVEAYESIKVTAGTFKAFKITAKQEKHLSKGVSMPQSTIYWYAPEVKQIVKKDRRAHGKFVELKSYKVE